MATEQAQAEAVIASLEARIVALEAAATEVTSTDAAAVSDVRDYQMHMLHSLRQVKAAIEADGGDSATLSAENARLRKENAELHNQVARLNYRVKHLLKALNAAEERAAAPAPKSE